MEVFSLLNYWKGSGGGATKDSGGTNVRTVNATTTISTAISSSAAGTDDDDGDEGPFFDLQFAVPEDDQEKQTTDGADEEREDDDDIDGTDVENEREEEFKFTLSPGSSGDCTDPNASLSPSDDLFFNGELIPVEPSSIVIDGSQQIEKPLFSLFKSATKFRVLMLKLKKSKANVVEKTEPESSDSAKQNEKQEDTQAQKQEQIRTQNEKQGETQTQTQKQKQSQTQNEKQGETQTQKQKQGQSQSKFFTVKFNVEEVPILSLFTRDNSSRASSGNTKSQMESSDEAASDDKRFSKDGMQKYLNMVKPLYIRVSKRYGEKSGFSGQLRLGGGIKAGPSPIPSEVQKSPEVKEPENAEAAESQPTVTAAAVTEGKNQKQGKLPAPLRMVCKHLGKSRSASAVAAAPATSGSATLQARRRDDSLLEQQDGIQSAILHCKTSFNAPRDSESSLFSRSVSDPSPKNPSN